MSTQSNGVNMLDVKKQNRSAILQTVYRSSGISRKDIANILGLTPAAITLITTDLIQENLLSETIANPTPGRKGRKEILLEFKKKSFASVGVYISKHNFHIVCTDLTCDVIFEETIYTADCHNHSENILAKVTEIIKTDLKNYDVLRTHTLIGIGICVHGIVDSQKGISLNSYGIWEENVAVSPVLEAVFHVPVILTNNICALAHGEAFLTHSHHPDNMLFIKYGPGVGAAKLTFSTFPSIYNYQAVELGHLVVEPDGNPCICGSQGCLETVAGYDAIEQSLSRLISESSSPILYKLTNGDSTKLSMKFIMEAYKYDERIALTAIHRATHYLALSIKNAICLLKSNNVVLYGELFEYDKFKDELINELNRFSIAENVSFSHYNLKLNAMGPATTSISHFIENGGMNLLNN